jgi:hypothetical protein
MLYFELLKIVFEFLKIDETFNVRLTCRLFNDIFKMIDYSPLKVLKRISLRGSTSEFLLQVLNKCLNINFDVFIKRFLLLNDIELLNVFIDYYNGHVNYFNTHTITFSYYYNYNNHKYFDTIEKIKSLFKFNNNNIKFLISNIIIGIMDAYDFYSEEMLIELINLENDYFSNYNFHRICVDKRYYKVLDNLLNEKLKTKEILCNLLLYQVSSLLKNIKNKKYIKHFIEDNENPVTYQNLVFLILLYCLEEEDEEVMEYFKQFDFLIFKYDLMKKIELRKSMFKSKRSIIISQTLKLEILFDDQEKIKDKYIKKLMKL